MSESKTQTLGSTPLNSIATVSRLVTLIVDRLAGDRSDVPLLVAAAAQRALKNLGHESRVMYGQAAWIEVLNGDQKPVWAGCWNGNVTFWLETELAETVDLNASVAHRKRPHDRPELQALYAPPILWSREIPAFYRYAAEGIAELELTEERDIQLWKRVCQELDEKSRPELLNEDFPNEPVLCPGRRVLDDSTQSFKHYERAIAVHGVPEAPF